MQSFLQFPSHTFPIAKPRIIKHDLESHVPFINLWLLLL